MEYVQAQYISLYKLNNSTDLFTGLFNKENAIASGANPITLNKIIPGIKKLLNGEFFNIDSGIPNSLPEGEIINTPPPNIAPIPSSTNNISKQFTVGFRFIFFNCNDF
jgi:hypothetical protein